MGNFSKSLVRRLSGHAPKGSHPSRPVNPAGLPENEGQIALHDGRKFWVQRVYRSEWHKMPRGAELMLIRTARRHEPWQLAVEMATVEDNKLSHPGAPCICLAWGMPPEGKPDKRPARILMRDELHAILRYEVRESHCPELVATINPSMN